MVALHRQHSSCHCSTGTGQRRGSSHLTRRACFLRSPGLLLEYEYTAGGCNFGRSPAGPTRRTPNEAQSFRHKVIEETTSAQATGVVCHWADEMLHVRLITKVEFNARHGAHTVPCQPPLAGSSLRPLHKPTSTRGVPIHGALPAHAVHRRQAGRYKLPVPWLFHSRKPLTIHTMCNPVDRAQVRSRELPQECPRRMQMMIQLSGPSGRKLNFSTTS